jgi:hypothetical protein
MNTKQAVQGRNHNQRLNANSKEFDQYQILPLTPTLNSMLCITCIEKICNLQVPRNTANILFRNEY